MDRPYLSVEEAEDLARAHQAATVAAEAYQRKMAEYNHRHFPLMPPVQNYNYHQQQPHQDLQQQQQHQRPEQQLVQQHHQVQHQQVQQQQQVQQEVQQQQQEVQQHGDKQHIQQQRVTRHFPGSNRPSSAQYRANQESRGRVLRRGRGNAREHGEEGVDEVGHHNG
ncbi:uncharacterized protein LOC141536945 [Cotesia typhae]|uniref:uncharacterized protein LOC141536945 n=1 Tax=Cotesia typhae TaxID=2053667 RepID=UPI003D6907C3